MKTKEFKNYSQARNYRNDLFFSGNLTVKLKEINKNKYIVEEV